MKTTGYSKHLAPHKANWRSLQWVKIRKRVVAAGKRPGDCVVLYLAGEEDLDWPEARKNGFSRHNILAVEKVPDACSQLRSSRVNVIHGTLAETVAAWAGTPKIDVVVADYTCGVCLETNDLIQALLSSKGTSGAVVVSVNLQRGRDPQFNQIKRSNMLSAKTEHLPHRGRGFVVFATDMIAAMLRSGKARPSPGYRDTKMYAMVETIIARSRPEYASYKSSQGNLYFDSVLLTWEIKFPDIKFKPGVFNEVRARIAAAKAIRTQRLKTSCQFV